MTNQNLRYWCELYQQHKREALAVDIETKHYDGPISVVSMYRKKSEWDAELMQFVNDGDDHSLALKDEFGKAKLLITFNGLAHDIPKLQSEYPQAIQEDVRVLDLCVLARSIGLKGGLKNMETVMGIKRSKEARQAEGKTHYLWRRITESEDEAALIQLLEYASDDVRNLFDLAEWLIEWAEAKMNLEKAPVNRMHEMSTSPILKML